MASMEQLRKIALRCSEYNNNMDKKELKMKNSNEENHKSCTNCTHYTKEGTCNIDLIDKVLSAMSMDLDLKS